MKAAGSAGAEGAGGDGAGAAELASAGTGAAGVGAGVTGAVREGDRPAADSDVPSDGEEPEVSGVTATGGSPSAVRAAAVKSTWKPRSTGAAGGAGRTMSEAELPAALSRGSTSPLQVDCVVLRSSLTARAWQSALGAWSHVPGSAVTHVPEVAHTWMVAASWRRPPLSVRVSTALVRDGLSMRTRRPASLKAPSGALATWKPPLRAGAAGWRVHHPTPVIPAAASAPAPEPKASTAPATRPAASTAPTDVRDLTAAPPAAVAAWARAERPHRPPRPVPPRG